MAHHYCFVLDRTRQVPQKMCIIFLKGVPAASRLECRKVEPALSPHRPLQGIQRFRMSAAKCSLLGQLVKCTVRLGGVASFLLAGWPLSWIIFPARKARTVVYPLKALCFFLSEGLLWYLSRLRLLCCKAKVNIVRISHKGFRSKRVCFMWASAH